MKLKICSACGNERPIWKNHEGNRYCKRCWARRHNPWGPPKIDGKKLRPVSKKREAQNKVYSELRRVFLNKPENGICHARLSGCTGSSQELTIHHKKGRGIYLLDVSTWIPLCVSCHRWVTDHPEQAEALGLSESRLTPLT